MNKTSEVEYKYEDCDFQNEKVLQKIILSLERQFKNHYIHFHSTLDIQCEILAVMWKLSQRFLILTMGTLCVQPYPPEPSNREEQEIRAKFSEQKELLEKSNCKLNASLCNLKSKCGAFDRALAKVGASLPSQIVEGTKTRQPIYYHIELFSDLFKYFNEAQKKLNVLGNFLMIEDIVSIVEYEHLLEPDKAVNEYFETCLKIGNQSEI